MVHKVVFFKISNVLFRVADSSFEQRRNVCFNIVPGRAVKLDIYDGQGNHCLSCMDIHKYGLNTAQLKATEDAHLSSCGAVRSSPNNGTLSFLELSVFSLRTSPGLFLAPLALRAPFVPMLVLSRQDGTLRLILWPQ